MRSGDEARALYESWWRERGSREQIIPTPEADAFLRLTSKWGSPAELSDWVSRHPDHRSAEYLRWAELFLGWNGADEAWSIITKETPEPKYPATTPRITPEQIEARWANHPEDIVNARNYAQQLELSGNKKGAADVITRVAESADAPRWFVEKAAYQLAAEQRFKEAVEAMLRSGNRKSK